MLYIVQNQLKMPDDKEEEGDDEDQEEEHGQRQIAFAEINRNFHARQVRSINILYIGEGEGER